MKGTACLHVFGSDSVLYSHSKQLLRPPVFISRGLLTLFRPPCSTVLFPRTMWVKSLARITEWVATRYGALPATRPMLATVSPFSSSRARRIYTGPLIEEFHISRLAGGKIVEQWGMPDVQGLMTQLNTSSVEPCRQFGCSITHRSRIVANSEVNAPIATRIPSPCLVENFSTAFLPPLKEYLPINRLEFNKRSCDGDPHASATISSLRDTFDEGSSLTAASSRPAARRRRAPPSGRAPGSRCGRETGVR